MELQNFCTLKYKRTCVIDVTPALNASQISNPDISIRILNNKEMNIKVVTCVKYPEVTKVYTESQPI